MERSDVKGHSENVHNAATTSSPVKSPYHTQGVCNVTVLVCFVLTGAFVQNVCFAGV